MDVWQEVTSFYEQYLYIKVFFYSEIMLGSQNVGCEMWVSKTESRGCMENTKRWFKPPLGYRSQLSAVFGGSQRGAFRLVNLTDKKTTTKSELNLKEEKKQATQSEAT